MTQLSVEEALLRNIKVLLRIPRDSIKIHSHSVSTYKLIQLLESESSLPLFPVPMTERELKLFEIFTQRLIRLQAQQKQLKQTKERAEKNDLITPSK